MAPDHDVERRIEMVLYRDMLVETGYPLADVEDRDLKPGHEHENECTYCVPGTWHPIADIVVYRVWTSTSVYTPDSPGKCSQGGTWQWRCREHEKRSWAPHSHQAPAELLPEFRGQCEERLPLQKTLCGKNEDTQLFDEGWYCSEHSRTYELRRRERVLLEGYLDPEASVGDSYH
jgi:hypothetical protein